MQLTMIRRWVIGGLAASLCVATLLHAYVGFFARYQWDDFCFGAAYRQQGLFATLESYYLHWFGRFTVVCLNFLVGVPGPRTFRLVPPLLIVAWAGLLVWSIRECGRLAGLILPWEVSAALGCTILLTTIEAAPDQWQAFYWQVSMFSYSAPLILVTAYAGLLARSARRPWRPEGVWYAAAGGLIMCMAGGCSETFVVPELVAALACAGVALASGRFRNSAGFATAIGGLLGSLLAFAVVVSAPGNAARMHASGFHSISRPSEAFLLSAHYTWQFLLALLDEHARLMAAACLVPLLLGWNTALPAPEVRRLLRSLRFRLGWYGFLCLVLLILVPSGIAPAVIATSYRPPDRALVVALYTLVAGAAVWSYGLGLILRASLPPAWRLQEYAMLGALIVAVLLFTNPLGSVRATVAQANVARVWAARWDGYDTAIAAAGNNTPRAARLVRQMSSIEEPGALPVDFDDRCADQYFGVSVAAGAG